MEKSQRESGVCGVGPAERTGKPRSRYCPGGNRALSSSDWRRPRNPREKKPLLIDSPPDLFACCVLHQYIMPLRANLHFPLLAFSFQQVTIPPGQLHARLIGRLEKV